MKRSPLRRVSAKRLKELAVYSARRKAFLRTYFICWVCHFRRSREIHHREGRGRNYLEESTWMAVCKPCHRRIHRNPAWARAKGFLA
jgi:hypothetical protein